MWPLNLRKLFGALCLLSIALLVVACHRPAYAIDSSLSLSQCRLDSWSIRDGLQLRTINAMSQTPDGFLWFASEDGLTRFDGNSFSIFNSSNTPGLKGHPMYTNMVDRGGNLWLGTAWTGFGTYSGGRYRPMSPTSESWNAIWCIFQAPDGSMWAGGDDTQPLYHMIGGVSRPIKTFTNSVRAIVSFQNGDLLCAQWQDGLARITKDGVLVPYPLAKRIPRCVMQCLIRTANGDIWCGTASSGLIRISGNRVRIYHQPDGLSSECVNCLYEDRERRLWIGTNNGLDGWDGHGFSHLRKVDGLPASDVHSILEDHEGNLWVGAGGGLCRFAEPKLIPINVMDGSDEVKVGPYSSMVAMRDGRVLCATDIGLSLLNRGGVTWIGGPYHHTTNAIAEGPDGVVWLYRSEANGNYAISAVREDDILRWERRDPTRDGVNPAWLVKPVVPGQTITRLVADRGAVHAFGAGIEYTVTTAGVLTRRSIPSGWTFDVERDSRGVYWVGSTSGLTRVGPDSAAFVNDGLPSGTHVIGIEVTDPDSLWLATDHGMVRYSQGHCHVFGLDAGLPTSGLSEIVRDGRNRLWIGSGDGFFAVSIDQILKYENGMIPRIPVARVYRADEGVRAFPGGCTAIQVNGDIWFEAEGGVTLVRSGYMTFNNLPPPVCILDTIVDRTHMTVGGRNVAPPGKGMLQVDFAALTFVAPERTRFRFRLFGLDAGWTELANRRTVTYTNLPPGRYKFQVAACNNDYIWNNAGASISFEIKPHFYQTLWFKTLNCLLAVAVLALAYRWRTRQARRRTLDLERKVAERTAELRESHDELEAAQIEIEGVVEKLEARNEELLATQDTLATANERLETLATTDGLTGLKNHRAFQEHLGFEWQRAMRSGSLLSLVLLDVDHFKRLNDTFGHPVGDDVLRQMAQTLAETVRECDFVARYGGEEFVIIAPDTTSDGAMLLAERVRAAIENADWPHRAITASFGVATTGLGLSDAATDLISRADRALYRSKSSGRNRVTHVNAIDRDATEKRGASHAADAAGTASEQG